MSDKAPSHFSDHDRATFDRLLEQCLAQLPEAIHDLFHDIPLIVEDHPAPHILREFEIESLDALCGLHDGIPLTERSVEDEAHLPHTITIYRRGIMAMAIDEHHALDLKELAEQIRITILHEVGHHFGLDEDDLAELGYD